MEIWKDIKGYEGLYQVSNLGRVKGLDRYVNCKYGRRKIKGKIMNYTTRSGYNVLVLRRNNKRQSKQVHRLVAEAFIPNPNNYPVVNHKDTNRKNNHVSNLEWVTVKENVLWSVNKMRGMRINQKNAKMYGICNRGNKYEVTINKKYYGRYETLKEAENVRNKILAELGFNYDFNN